MDEINDQQQIASEITNAISNPLGMDNAIDEEELENELRELEAQELDSKLLQLPEAPTSKLASMTTTKPSKEDEDEELRQLEQAFA